VAKRPLPCAILMSQLKFGALWMNLDWRRRPNGNDSGSSGGWIKRRSICFRRLNPFSSESAVRDYEARLRSIRAVARRAIPTKSQVEQLAQNARKRMWEENPEW
jgi:hypothetical protein